MLAVMSDESAERHRRDRMAEAAAAYCHPRLGIQTTVDGAGAGAIGSICIIGVPRGCQFNPVTQMIVYPDGTETDAPPFAPALPSPDVSELPAPVAVEPTPAPEPLPVITESEPVGDVTVLNAWRRRKRDGEDPSGAA
jgi:hypothetical protein